MFVRTYKTVVDNNEAASALGRLLIGSYITWYVCESTEYPCIKTISNLDFIHNVIEILPPAVTALHLCVLHL